ncbi:MAG TPA: hypothetical protein PLI75_12935 [Anaerolineales bacterium]|nr:hypothetical protein [Anaerolineales bacterium]HND92688.1 hypothetical protein [Anaerolineales bacterium]
MQDFPQPTDLGNGLSWTAKFIDWEWARYGRFYFLVDLYQGGIAIKQLKIYTDDYGYGDPNRKQTNAELMERVRATLHAHALSGESNTDAVESG